MDLLSKFLSSDGVSTDTRSLRQNQIFFALKGNNFNGNEYLEQAIEKGACMAIGDEGHFDDHRIITVDDALAELQSLAKAYRQYIDPYVIAITGSNGKTTTKEVLAKLLSADHKVGTTQGNLNNHIGVPLTLLSFDRNVEYGVVEMGANHIGEIAQLCQIASPNAGIITNIGKAHLEGFGSINGIKQAKGELYDYLKKNKGRIFVNREEAHLQELLGDYENVVYFSDERPSEDLKIDKTEGDYVSFSLCSGDACYFVDTQLAGAFNHKNIAAGMAIASDLGIEAKEIAISLEGFQSVGHRSKIIECNGIKIFADTYNANPTSMRRAIESFSRLSTGESGTMVLGEMKELGADSRHEHLEILRELLDLDIKIILIGEEFLKLARPDSRVDFYLSAKDAIESGRIDEINTNWVMIKGSRSVGLEKIIDHLQKARRSYK